jgi:probable phosphoglycerate mutase
MLGESLKELGAVALYSSAMRRAVATAEPIALACNLVPIVRPELHERRLGPLSGVSREEGWSMYAQSKSRWIEGDLEYSHPGGESYADIRRRVMPVLESVITGHPGETMIIVAHGVVIRVILTSLLAGYQPGDFDRIAIDFASINDLWFDGAKWTARELNRVIAASTARPVA